MLKEISKQDKRWREHAFMLCKCRHLADDIVQEMYLRMYRNPKEQANDNYILLVIKSVWMNYLKTKKMQSSTDDLYYIKSVDNTFEPDDEQQELLDKIKKLDWVKQELLIEIYDRSLREIEEIYPLVNYAYAFREIKKAKSIILDK